MNLSEQPPEFRPTPSHPVRPPGGYVWAPHDTSGTSKQRRPGAATAASVLGIVSGSLGIMLSFIFAGLALFISMETQKGATSGTIGLGVLYFFAVGLPVAAVLLLVSGIVFLLRKGYASLIAGTVMQLLLSGAFLLFHLTVGRGRHAPSLIGGTVSLGLAVASLILLFSPSVKMWQRQGQSTGHGA
ncbi:hypothetical protein EII34_09255 [Arachnia propionica]|uniref:Uncharacterized protein n=2 Tax=Arachnia propionica TaxID=1750 RepID=A0A3P1T5D4_9ACTN|nr:hypothetical protein [Arachnia propionica]RRD04717.1 hypothetical protein EII34_09255 [Arachnia propionica]